MVVKYYCFWITRLRMLRNYDLGFYCPVSNFVDMSSIAVSGKVAAVTDSWVFPCCVHLLNCPVKETLLLDNTSLSNYSYTLYSIPGWVKQNFCWLALSIIHPFSTISLEYKTFYHRGDFSSVQSLLNIWCVQSILEGLDFRKFPLYLERYSHSEQ